MLWGLIGLIYLSNLFVPILEIDAAQYAEMSREMLVRDNWLHLYDLGADYLDKPPFLFWVSAFSMKMFGISTWAYKLPSILFGIWAIYALFKFTSLFYSYETAQKTSLLFASCQAMFLVTNDIKTDTILLSFAITAFWQIASWLYKKNKWGWIWGAICIGGAMLTKGPIGLLIIGFGFLPHFIIKKQWQNLYRWQYLPMLFIIALVLLPMSYGLYTQFDLQPDKFVNGKKGVSGLQFFYWTQSFGRITGESVWNNNAGFTFLYSNLLWGMIPFTIFFVMATVKGFIKLVKRSTQTEWISTATVLLGYLSLGMSKFQLPHYIYVVLPFICLLTARYFVSTKNYFGHKYRILRMLHNPILYLIVLIFSVSILWIFPAASSLQKALVSLIIIAIGTSIFLEKKQKISLFITAIFLSVLTNVIMNFVFYPNLIGYQKEYTIAQEIKNRKIDSSQLAAYHFEMFRSLDFLLQHNVAITKKHEPEKYRYLIVDEKGTNKLDSLQQKYVTLYEGNAYHIARLKFGFLNPNTRSQFTTPYKIVELK